MKNVVVLGSTGSIGINTLKVIARLKNDFRVLGLSAYRNVELLKKQIEHFNPEYIALDHDHIAYLKKKMDGRHIKIFDTANGLEKLATLKKADIIVIGIEGSAALKPFLAAVRKGKTIAPANKEALVMAGHLIMREAKKYGATIIPVDSEQSAIFQCLQGYPRSQVHKVFLTASGGPLRHVEKKSFDAIPVHKILQHPCWKMGKKITVDSATLMNKGLEVIEAMWLFGLNAKDIQVIVHPESVVHSMVEFKDGVVMAQMSVTDMRIPIQYALTYPLRVKTGLRSFDFFKQGTLTFEKPDFQKFPSLRLCYDVARRGKTYGSVLNAANEQGVEAFLKGKIKFSQIYQIVAQVVRQHRASAKCGINEILKADEWARQQAHQLIG